MLEAQECFGLTVAGLLPQIGAWILAAMMPDEGTGGEDDPVAGLLEPPADVDVVAGGAVSGIEAVDRQQRLAAKRHVAARNVLGDLIAFEDVGRLARRRGD